MLLGFRSNLSFAMIFLFAVMLFSGGVASFAQKSDTKQNSGFNLALHAISNVTATDIGLPDYPGATLYKNPDKNNSDKDSAVDLGFNFGNIHFTVKAAEYVTHDSSAQVLAFYRKSLSHYGEVLECKDGRAVGALTVTSSGLTCGNHDSGSGESKGSGESSSDHELRAGRPHRYRIVGIDESHPGSTRFGLVYLELPRDSNGDGTTK